jgi:Tfp pilus assembly protein PilO
MSLTMDRRLLAELVIMLTACVGAWVMFVDPRSRELSRLETEIAHAKSNPLLQNPAQVAIMADRLGDMRDRVAEIRRMNDVALDSSRLYGLIKDLAEASGVVVHRLGPGSAERRERGEGDPVSVAAFDVRVEGSYEQVASLVRAIEEIDGFVRPVSLTVSPRQVEGRSLVEARFLCEAVSFALPDALTALAGEIDAVGDGGVLGGQEHGG